MNAHDSYRRVGSVLLALAVLASGLGLAPDAALATAGVPSSFYYYADGQRIPLAVSTQWAAVRFADADPLQQASALQEAGAPLDASGERRELGRSGITLLPVTPGHSQEDLLEGLRGMQQPGGLIEQARPVFAADHAQLIVTDEFFASFPAGMSRKQIERINARYGASILREVSDQPNTFILKVEQGSELDALAMSNLYQENADALSAAPNFIMLLPARERTASAPAGPQPLIPVPNDTEFANQWGLQTLGTAVIFDDNDIDAPEAWTITTGDPSVKIAIIGTGVELTHPDLASNIGPGYDATDGGLADGAACTTPCGYNDVDADADGTISAGVAAAVTNNGTGIAGACPNCQIMSVRVATYDYSGNYWLYLSDIVEGITWAYQNGAAVIHTDLWATPISPLTTAINNAKTRGRGGKGSVIVASAGDWGGAVSYPASLGSVIGVGGLNFCAQRKTYTDGFCGNYENWWASNFGSPLDLMAPGVNIAATDRTGTYGWDATDYVYNGGSWMASPYVAGVAGLVLSVNPDLTSAQVYTVLTKNADDVGPKGKDTQTGFGRVNAYRAVTAAQTMRVMTNLKHGTVLDTSVYIPGLSSTAVERPGVTLDPAQVASSDGIQKRVASMASLWYSAENPVSYSEMMGLPKAQLSTEYWFPWYNNLDTTTMRQTLIITNADLVYNNTVQVYIGGVALVPTSTLGPGERTTYSVTYDNGPLRIRSVNGKKFIASLQAQAAQSSTTVSSSEMMGLPKAQLATEYWFPWYTGAGAGINPAETLRVANTNLLYTANVQVWMGTTLLETIQVPKNTSIERDYDLGSLGLSAGPLRVKTTNAKKIVASIGATYGGSTYSEWMGIPKPKITHTYYFPQYVNGGILDEDFRIVNVDAYPTTVEVMINGVVKGTYDLSPGAWVTDNYDFYEGPVRVRSTNLKKILVSEQSSIVSGGMPASYSELIGLPYTLLSPEYWFPVYDDTSSSLMEFVRMGRP